MPDDRLKLRITIAHESEYLYACAPIEERARFENEVNQTVKNAFDLSKYEPSVSIMYVRRDK